MAKVDNGFDQVSDGFQIDMGIEVEEVSAVIKPISNRIDISEAKKRGVKVDMYFLVILAQNFYDLEKINVTIAEVVSVQKKDLQD